MMRIVAFLAIPALPGAIWWLFKPAEPNFLGMFAAGAGFLSVVYLVVRELGAQPNLVIEADTDRPKPTIEPGYGLHHLRVTNKPVKWYVSIFSPHISPEGAQLFVRYTRVDRGRDELASCGQWLLGRWDINPQPKDPVDISGNQLLGKLFPAQAETPAPLNFTVSFALKQEGKPEFYHFNDESYRWSGDRGTPLRFCNPAWRLEGKVYKVEVKIVGQGLRSAKDATFRLRNPDTTLANFTLAQWQ